MDIYEVKNDVINLESRAEKLEDALSDLRLKLANLTAMIDLIRGQIVGNQIVITRHEMEIKNRRFR